MKKFLLRAYLVYSICSETIVLGGIVYLMFTNT